MIDFKLMLEIDRLNKTVDAFASQMKIVLAAKANEDKRGWDGNMPSDSYIIRELWNDATGLEQCATANQVGTNCNPALIDIANRAMILWARHNSLDITKKGI